MRNNRTYDKYQDCICNVCRPDPICIFVQLVYTLIFRFHLSTSKHFDYLYDNTPAIESIPSCSLKEIRCIFQTAEKKRRTIFRKFICCHILRIFQLTFRSCTSFSWLIWVQYSQSKPHDLWTMTSNDLDLYHFLRSRALRLQPKTLNL